MLNNWSLYIKNEYSEIFYATIKKQRRFYHWLFILTIFLNISVFASPKTELRGIWVSSPLDLNWEEVILNIKKAGFNNIFVNFASAGVTFYPSDILPSIKPKNSFKELISIAHKHGIAVHAKILAFFMFWAPEFQIEKMKKEGRILLSTKGKLQLQASTPWLDPAQIENREQVKNLIKEIISKYDVDGIQLDYVRFFEEKDAPMSIIKIRQSILTNFVSNTATLIQKINSNIRYSACIFWNLKRAKHEMAQDWDTWVDKKLFSFLVPMNYTVQPTKLSSWINDQDIERQGGTTFYSGLGAYMKKMTPEILLKEINIVRNSKTPGFILFSYTDEFVKKKLPFLIKHINK